MLDHIHAFPSGSFQTPAKNQSLKVLSAFFMKIFSFLLVIQRTPLYDMYRTLDLYPDETSRHPCQNGETSGTEGLQTWIKSE